MRNRNLFGTLFIACVLLLAEVPAFAQFNQGGISQTRKANDIVWTTTSGANLGRLDNDNARVGTAGVAQSFTITSAKDVTTNGTDITFTALDSFGTAVPFAVFDIFLSDSTTGAGLTLTTGSGSSGTLGGVTAGKTQSGACDSAAVSGLSIDSTNGTCLAVLITKKSLRVMANASGSYVWQIIDSAKTLWVPVATASFGTTTVGAALTAAKYQ
jgi:hypothetical protein